MYSWSTIFSDLFTRCRYLIVIVIPESSYLLGWKACSSYPDAVSDYVCISSLYRIIELNCIYTYIHIYIYTYILNNPKQVI